MKKLIQHKVTRMTKVNLKASKIRASKTSPKYQRKECMNEVWAPNMRKIFHRTLLMIRRSNVSLDQVTSVSKCRVAHRHISNLKRLLKDLLDNYNNIMSMRENLLQNNN